MVEKLLNHLSEPKENMKFEQFLSMGNGETMTPQQAHELNQALACAAASDFSQGQRSRIADYIATALNMNSVEADLVPSLDALLLSLQHPA